MLHHAHVCDGARVVRQLESLQDHAFLFPAILPRADLLLPLLRCTLWLVSSSCRRRDDTLLELGDSVWRATHRDAAVETLLRHRRSLPKSQIRPHQCVLLLVIVERVWRVEVAGRHLALVREVQLITRGRLPCRCVGLLLRLASLMDTAAHLLASSLSRRLVLSTSRGVRCVTRLTLPASSRRSALLPMRKLVVTTVGTCT